MSRIDGFLSREVIVALKGKEITRYPLHIIKPSLTDSDNISGFPIIRNHLRIESYKIIPYSSEIPFICYVDSPLKITESENGCFILSI